MHAVILAGGRSRRLGGVAKAGLLIEGQTLLARTVDAAAQLIGILPRPADVERLSKPPHSPQPSDHLSPGERPPAGQHFLRVQHPGGGDGPAQGRLVVVGPVRETAAWLEGSAWAAAVTVIQEDPPFSGPAAGIAAALMMLDEGAAANSTVEDTAGRVLVLSCDLPRAGEVASLLAAELATCPTATAVMAVDAGRQQPLAAIYPVAALRAATEDARAAHRLENASVFSLLASVNVKEIAVPPGMTADIDTWDDARAHGIVAATPAAEG